jgi:hypothetical protein
MIDPKMAKEYYNKAVALCAPGMEDLKKIAMDRM